MAHKIQIVIWRQFSNKKLIPKLEFYYSYYKNHNYEINLYASFGTAESKLLPIPSLYLEKIRNNEATDGFLSQIKGKILHHHFSGSIYAEPILEDAIAEDFT
jgi:hypothetical protein